MIDHRWDMQGISNDKHVCVPIIWNIILRSRINYMNLLRFIIMVVRLHIYSLTTLCYYVGTTANNWHVCMRF